MTMAGFWIGLIKVSQGFEYAYSFKHARARNLARLWICKGYKWCWMCLNNLKYALTLPQYASICPNSAKYLWICLSIPEYARVLNVSDAYGTFYLTATIQVTEQLSRQRRIQNTVKHLRWNILQKWIVPECIHATKSLQGMGIWWN